MRKVKKLMVSFLSVVMLCCNMMYANAAEINDRAVESANGDTVIESYWTTDAYGDSMYVMFTYNYSDGNSVYRSGFSHTTSGGKTWSESLKDTYAGDTLYSTATLTCVYSFSCSAWCDIYGQTGH